MFLAKKNNLAWPCYVYNDLHRVLQAASNSCGPSDFPLFLQTNLTDICCHANFVCFLYGCELLFLPAKCISHHSYWLYWVCLGFWICLTWLMLSSLNKLANGVWTTTWIRYITHKKNLTDATRYGFPPYCKISHNEYWVKLPPFETSQWKYVFTVSFNIPLVSSPSLIFLLAKIGTVSLFFPLYQHLVV